MVASAIVEAKGFVTLRLTLGKADMKRGGRFRTGIC